MQADVKRGECEETFLDLFKTRILYEFGMSKLRNNKHAVLDKHLKHENAYILVNDVLQKPLSPTLLRVAFRVVLCWHKERLRSLIL